MTEQNDAVVRGKCYECSGTMLGRRENYRYTECGLESVTLVDIVVFHCKCGAIVPEIPAAGALHWVIAMEVLRKSTLLSGEEIRFLRKLAGYKAMKLAAIMGIAPEVVSRWENDKQPIGKESDRLVRWVCFDGILRNEMPDLAGDPAEVLEFVKRAASLNLPDLMQEIETDGNESKTIRVNPEILSSFSFGSPSPAVQ
jgi:transcriptional regulator with XRE-family HTH domain